MNYFIFNMTNLTEQIKQIDAFCTPENLAAKIVMVDEGDSDHNFWVAYEASNFRTPSEKILTCGLDSDAVFRNASKLLLDRSIPVSFSPVSPDWENSEVAFLCKD